VYRAVDTRLQRQVAIKVLPEAVRSDPERVARFEREAKLLASLNHPNIAGIHGLDQANGEQFIVIGRGVDPRGSDCRRSGPRSRSAADRRRTGGRSRDRGHSPRVPWKGATSGFMGWPHEWDSPADSSSSLPHGSTA
jgi:hypothetical protein